jgi:GR25 family glycosyltransferase involved in LPS biosynthesis
MSILGKYFDKAYCINLDRRLDRWETTQPMFNKLGFGEIERYRAIDGKTMDLTKFKNKGPLLVGELGIMQTHINIITEAKEKCYKNILILEDDVYFSNEIHNLESYMNLVPDDWDMIYFGGSHNHGKPTTKVNNKIIKLGKSVSLQCVAIKDTIYDKILEITKDRLKTIDSYYSDLHLTTNAYGFAPSMAFQNVGYSDIQGQIVDYNSQFK